MKNIFFFQMLYLDSNRLTEFPQELFLRLPHLQYLDVRNNRLKSIPPTIRGHQQLQTFLLQDNDIEKLPLELGKKTILDKFYKQKKMSANLETFFYFLKEIYKFVKKFLYCKFMKSSKILGISL